MTVVSPAQTDTAAAAAELLERRCTNKRGPVLSESVRPRTLLQALAIQQAVTEQWCARFDDTVGAWKAGMPAMSNAAPDQFDKLVLAPVFASTICRGERAEVWPGFNPATRMPVARIEPELAFVLARDLPVRNEPYLADEVRDAVGQVHMALELVVNRYDDSADCAFADKLADSLENQGLFIGPAVDKRLAFDARELSLTLEQGADTRALKGRHPAGDPLAPLYWLAEFLRSRGQALRAGQAVITGCYSEKVLEIDFDRSIKLRYQSSDGHRLGELQVEFRQKGTRP